MDGLSHVFASGPLDFRTIESMADHPSAIEGLKSVIPVLEEFLEPHVTTTRTNCVCAYKGKRRYLPTPNKEVVLVAAWSLNWLYRAVAAIEAGDMDATIRAVLAFAKVDQELHGLATFGLAPTQALAQKLAHKAAAAKGGLATAKWTPEIEALARLIFDQVKRGNGKVSNEAAYQRTKARLLAEHDIDISVPTLKRRLPVQR